MCSSGGCVQEEQGWYTYWVPGRHIQGYCAGCRGTRVVYPACSRRAQEASFATFNTVFEVQEASFATLTVLEESRRPLCLF